MSLRRFDGIGWKFPWAARPEEIPPQIVAIRPASGSCSTQVVRWKLLFVGMGPIVCHHCCPVVEPRGRVLRSSEENFDSQMLLDPLHSVNLIFLVADDTLGSNGSVRAKIHFTELCNEGYLARRLFNQL
jgi:hypothetical protein